MPKPLLIVEFLALFVALPLIFRLSPVQIPPLPVLWAATFYCVYVLMHDPSFQHSQLWNAGAIPRQLLSITAIFAVIAVLLALLVHRWTPDLLFGFVRTRPALWALVMILYPVLSVYPQGIVYRAFLMHRYAGLLGGLPSDAATQQFLLILLSATAFGFMHIVFRNPIAVSFTFFGGLLFAWRYIATGSLAASSLEHALYGCMLFTIGLGQYFYHGRVRLQ